MKKIGWCALWGGGLFLALLVNGALPFFMVPTLGQAIWSMGFAQSLANSAFFSAHAYNFGMPQPAAIAFGLSGVWSASLLLRLGLQPMDAYASMAAIWLALAFFSCRRIALDFGATQLAAWLASLVWLSMPIVWAHTGYSLLSLGIALLPFYFLASLRLLRLDPRKRLRAGGMAAYYALAAVISVFMDGYTFVMFAVGASILLAHAVCTRPEARAALLRFAAPLHAASFALAYLLYRSYVGRGSYGGSALDFFRGWGVDLSYLAIPTKGMLWLADALGLGLERSNAFHFGDASVWETTFCLPLALLGLLAWRRARRGGMALGIVLVALAGFYMSLGPSLKVDSLKPAALRAAHPREQSVLMPADLAVMPTGSAWISEHLPGFREMRASYRWSALAFFALWLLVVAGGPYADKRRLRLWYLLLLATVLINIPDPQKLRDYASLRVMFKRIDAELVGSMKSYVQPGETVAFLPWSNDFLAGYLASRLKFRTFNIGGDKNLAIAQQKWPAEMGMVGDELDQEDAWPEARMLVSRTADVLVLPYFDMLWSAHIWPCLREAKVPLSEESERNVRAIPGFLCPDEQRAAWQPELDALRRIPYLSVTDADLFATVRLRPEYRGARNQPALLDALLKDIQYPIDLNARFKESAYILRRGWHAPEADFTWSTGSATLLLPKPQPCDDGHCAAVLHFQVFGASPQRPVTVALAALGEGPAWSGGVTATSSEPMAVRVPLAGPHGWRGYSITVPEAASPKALIDTPDTRVLGIALRRVELERGSPGG